MFCDVWTDVVCVNVVGAAGGGVISGVWVGLRSWMTVCRGCLVLLICRVPGVMSSFLESSVSLSFLFHFPMRICVAVPQEDELVHKGLLEHGRLIFYNILSHADRGSAVCHLSVHRRFCPGCRIFGDSLCECCVLCKCQLSHWCIWISKGLWWIYLARSSKKSETWLFLTGFCRRG